MWRGIKSKNTSSQNEVPMQSKRCDNDGTNKKYKVKKRDGVT